MEGKFEPLTSAATKTKLPVLGANPLLADLGQRSLALRAMDFSRHGQDCVVSMAANHADFLAEAVFVI